MSGGSWNYAYQTFEEVAERLSASENPHRRALGDLIAKLVPAMREVEWVDSNDSANGDEDAVILAALGPALILESAHAALREEIERAALILNLYQPVKPMPPGPPR